MSKKQKVFIVHNGIWGRDEYEDYHEIKCKKIDKLFKWKKKRLDRGEDVQDVLDNLSLKVEKKYPDGRDYEMIFTILDDSFNCIDHETKFTAREDFIIDDEQLATSVSFESMEKAKQEMEKLKEAWVERCREIITQ